MSVIVGIQYEEFGGQETYEKITVKDMEHDRYQEFASGDFLDFPEDWQEAMMTAVEWSQDGDGMILNSSTVDNFFSEPNPIWKVDE